VSLPSEAAPAWFSQAVEQKPTSHYAKCDGFRVHYLAWNEQDRDKPAILLAHGYRAHAHWWDFIAPFFCADYRVFALDFCGMGDSDWRPTYTAETFVDELRAVIEHAGLAKATLIGHSYGGTRVLRACIRFPELIEQAIVVDSYVAFIDRDRPSIPRQYGGAFYPDADSAIQRFRLLPEQPVHDWARAYIARHSLKETEHGWTWKFDPDLPYAIFERDGEALLRAITVPLDLVCGEHSVVFDRERALRVGQVLASLPNARGPVTLPDAYHHLMLDQPLALVSTLRALLA